MTSIFSILKLILLSQSYTTIWIYSDQFNSDLICEYFMEEHEFQPKSFFDLNNFKNPNSLIFNFEQQYFFQNTLHVFFINHSLDEYVLDHIPTEENIVVVSENDNVDRILPPKKPDQFGRKILFITNLNLSLLKPSKNHYVLESIPINSSESIIADFVGNVFSSQYKYSHYNMNGSVFITFFKQKDAHCFIQPFDNKLLYSGPDGFVTEQLGHIFNGTLIINTDFGIDYPEYKRFYTPAALPYNYFINFHKEIVTKNVISSFNQSNSGYADLYMSAQQLKRVNLRSKSSTEFLYPHITDCLRIMVPRINAKQSFLIKLIRNQYCQIICLAFLLMALFKIIFGRTAIHKWPHDIFITLGIFLAQCNINQSNRSWESIWNGLLIFFSLNSTALLSALCYKTLVSEQFQEQINSLQDLIESNLTIFVPKLLAADIQAWGPNLNPKLAEKIVIKNQLYMRENDSEFATVWPEGMAKMLLKFTPVNTTVREMRLMKDPLYCGLVSYSVAFRSPLKQIVDTIFRRMFESGLSSKHLEWSNRFLNAMSSKLSEIQVMSTSNDQTLNMSQLSGVFILYGVGICISLSVALTEILWKRITNYKLNVPLEPVPSYSVAFWTFAMGAAKMRASNFRKFEAMERSNEVGHEIVRE